MPAMNDNSADPKDWTNRKLIATIRTSLRINPLYHDIEVGTAALDVLEKRVVRSSSRNNDK